MMEQKRPSIHSDVANASWTSTEKFRTVNRSKTSHNTHSLENIAIAAEENKLRRELRKILGSMPFDLFIGALVLINFAILWYETDQRVQGSNPHKRGWTSVVQMSVAFFFVCEVALKIYLRRRQFFLSKLNIFDLFVVVLGGVMEMLSWFSIFDAKGFSGLLRICRVARLFHIARLLKNTDEFWALLSGLANASKTLFWASILMFGILSCFSLVAVEALQPLMDEIAASGMYSECPWCKDAFNSVMESNLTLFGCISGGDWPMLARPLIVAYPQTGLIFILVIFIMFFGMINLITAVIVDAAAAAREQDVVKKSRKRLQEQERALHDLQILCTEMDADDSGSISLDELIDGYNTNSRFTALMQLMDIGEDELQCVFDVLDKEKLGEVPHVAFTQQLWKMKSQEVKTSLMFVTHSLDQLHAQTESLINLNRQCSKVVQESLRDLHDALSRGSTTMQEQAPTKIAQLETDLAQLFTPRSAASNGTELTLVNDSHLPLSLEKPNKDRTHLQNQLHSDLEVMACLSTPTSGASELAPVLPRYANSPAEFLRPRGLGVDTLKDVG